jgi:ABC-type phosphate transport system substrate-binding protein
MLLLLLLAPLAPAQDEKPAEPKTEPGTELKPNEVALAVIVHPKNPIKKLSFKQLRAYMQLERKMWPNNKAVTIFLPTRKSDAYRILLKKLYRKSHKRLQKYWVRKQFAGDIPSKPSYVPNAKAAGKQVAKTLGGVSVVAADEIPKGVRVLLLDGKKPGEKGYPLVGERKAKKKPSS